MLFRENIIKSLKDNIIKELSGIKFQELPFIRKINLRGNPEDKSFIISTGKILDTLLPIETNKYTKKNNIKAIWLGPNEWLIVNENETNIYDQLLKIFDNKEISVTDVSENRTVLRVSGKRLFTLLSKFLVLDLEKNLSNESSCCQTIFVKVPVLIVRNQNNNDETSVDIYTNRSHANYIYELLVDGTKNLDS